MVVILMHQKKPPKTDIHTKNSYNKYSLFMRGIKMQSPSKIIFGWIASIYMWVYLFFMNCYAVPKSTWLWSKWFD